MRCINSGQIGAYRTPQSGILSLPALQQSKSGYSQPIPVRILSVAGGASGNYFYTGFGGGGGGGGVIETDFTLASGTTYAITVGAAGSYSSFGTAMFSIGGNCGIGANQQGSPGGAKHPPQGYQGGYSTEYAGAGGGGAGGVGGDAGFPDNGGFGGIGRSSTITGSTTYWGGGGGGGGSTRYASGGLGGGGAYGTNGAANTGGGGGAQGASGGSGTNIMRILTFLYTGKITGTTVVTTDGLFTIVKWNSSGTYTA